MSVLVLVEIEIHNPELYDEYKKLTPASIEAFGGRFVVRGGAHQSVEGDWNPARLVVLEFKDMATANAWWNSSQYTEAKLIRQQAAQTKMLFIETLE